MCIKLWSPTVIATDAQTVLNFLIVGIEYQNGSHQLPANDDVLYNYFLSIFVICQKTGWHQKAKPVASYWGFLNIQCKNNESNPT